MCLAISIAVADFASSSGCVRNLLFEPSAGFNHYTTWGNSSLLFNYTSFRRSTIKTCFGNHVGHPRFFQAVKLVLGTCATRQRTGCTGARRSPSHVGGICRVLRRRTLPDKRLLHEQLTLQAITVNRADSRCNAFQSDLGLVLVRAALEAPQMLANNSRLHAMQR